MIIEPGLLPVAGLFLLVLSMLAVPLAAGVFFACALLLFLNPEPLPPGFVFSYSLAMRLNSQALISIPLFALAGELAVAAGISDRLLDVADALSGGGRHAVGKRSVLGCALFASVSGVGPAAVAEEGRRLIPDMLGAGYGRGTAAGLLATAATLSIIIPASIPLTIYAATVGLQTNIVFAASFVPGLLVAAALFLAVIVHDAVHRRKSPPAEPARHDRWRVIAGAKWAIALPVLVLSSLFSGFLTAPEAAAFASAYAFCAGARRIGMAGLRDALARAGTAASAVLLLAGVGGLGIMLLESGGFIDRFSGWLFALSGGRAGAILAMNAILLVAGCFLDMPAIITLVAPLFLPLAARCGMNLPHYGAMVVVNLAIGLVTPPQAHNIAAAAHAAGTGMRAAAKGSIPFLFAMLACLVAVAYIPDISLRLPALLGWPIR